jgi:major membrane immunogen (membrane-anchored lipoprotein)
MLKGKRKLKKIIAILMTLLVLVTMVACGNKDMFDTVYTYDYAIIAFPDGTSKKVEIKQWTDYEDGDQLQIKATDGTVYLVHSEDCVLVQEN